MGIIILICGIKRIYTIIYQKPDIIYYDKLYVYSSVNTQIKL